MRLSVDGVGAVPVGEERAVIGDLAVLLGKAWGLTKDWLVLAIVASAYYYTGFEGLNMVEAAVGDILG